jgi:hypothetical protein
MINEITINGKIEVDKPIDPETEYALYLERIQNDQGKVSKWINKNDTSVYTSKMVNLGVAMLKQGDEVIMGKAKKGSKSQALRQEVRELWEMAYSGEIGEEKFYNQWMDKFFKIIKDEKQKYEA